MNATMPARSVNRVLWPTDFSDSDHDSLAIAGFLAGSWRADLIALHVIPDVAEEVYGEKETEGKDRTAWALWKLSKDKAETRLRDIITATLPGFSRFRTLVAFGDPATRIVNMVREERVGMVVMSARRDRTLLQEMLLGSVAYKVVRTVPSNVMLVK